MRVELQAEVEVPRDRLFRLVSTPEGLATWLDVVEFEGRVGAPVRLRLRESDAVGEVRALDPPQHISWSWDWESESIGVPSVVSFDLIQHGRRTHLTVRHVGFRTGAQRDLHEQVWRYWFRRLLDAAGRSGAAVAEADASG